MNAIQDKKSRCNLIQLRKPKAKQTLRRCMTALGLALGTLLIGQTPHLARAQTDLTGQYTWKPVKIGAGGFMRGMAIHPANTNVRYIRADVDGAYRWDATNNIWVQTKIASAFPANATASPTNSGCGAIGLDPNQQNVVYMAYTFGHSSDVQSFAPTVNLDVYKSTDGGRTFKPGGMSLGDDSNNYLSQEAGGERITVDPNNSNIVYFGSPKNGLWRTTDGGNSWNNVTSGGAPSSTANVGMIVFDKGAGTGSLGGQSASRRVYIQTGGSILMSNDGGNNWTNITAGQGNDGNCGHMDIASDGSFLVAANNSVWKYPRGGGWSSAFVPAGVNTFSVDPNNPQRIFTIAGGGDVCRSTNGGTSFVGLGQYLLLSNYNPISWLQPGATPNRPNSHYISSGGIYVDTNGRLWIPCGNDGCLTATTDDNQNTASNPIVWSNAAVGIEETVGQGATIPPGGLPWFVSEDEMGFQISNPDIFTALHYDVNPWIYSNGLGSAMDVAYCPNQPQFMVSNPSNTFSGSPQNTNMAGYSTNGGQHWQRFGSIVNGNHPAILYSGQMAVSARASGHEYDGAGSDNIVWVGVNLYYPQSTVPFYSTDGGNTWTKTTSLGSSDFTGFQWGPWNPALKQHLLEADPKTPGTFYWDAASGGFWRSTDKGVTWNQLSNNGLPLRMHHGQMKANPFVSGDLWICDGIEGADAHGMWHSTNGGTSFAPIAGWDYCDDLALGKAADGAPYPTLYAYGKRSGDPNYGIFQSTDKANTWNRIANYPLGIFDLPAGIAASWDTFGLVYITWEGNSAAYGVQTSTGLFSTSFETSNSDPQPTWNNSPDNDYWSSNSNPQNVSGYISSVGPECGVRSNGDSGAGPNANTGSNMLMTAGTANAGSGGTYCYYKVFDLSSNPISITSSSSISYSIFPNQDNGRYIGVDFICKDGTTLRDSGIKDQRGASVHPNGGHVGGDGSSIPLGSWTQVSASLAALAGKQITRIWVAYDHAGSTGQYRAYIDDLTISPTSSGTPTNLTAN